MRRLLAVLVPALVLAGVPQQSAVSLARPSAAGSCSGEHWVGAWSAAPSDAVASLPTAAQTLRSQAWLSHGGVAVRVHLSNRFGHTPLQVSGATVARQEEGAAAVPGSMRRLRFHGRPGVTVPAGTDVVSDPVRLSTRTAQTLLVSLDLPTVSGPATQHVLAEQTTWRTAPGMTGHAADTSADAFTIGTPLRGAPVAAPQAVSYVDAVDVLTARRVGTVVAFGDSITDGFQGTLSPVLPAADPVDRNGRYPDLLARRIRAAGLPLAVANAGISGNQLLADAQVPIFGPSGLSRLGVDGLRRAGITTMILLEGINDIGQSRATAAALIRGYRTVARRAHRAGVRLLLGTLTPDGGTLQPGYGAQGEPTRLAVNRWIRSQHVADGVVDFDRAVRDPADRRRIRPAYDGGDHLHFSRAGYAAMARAVPLRSLRPGC